MHDAIKRKFLTKFLLVSPIITVLSTKAFADNKLIPDAVQQSNINKKIYNSDAGENSEKGLNQTYRLKLSNPDGLKYIGQCLCVEDLRKIIPELSGQRISLASFHRYGWGGVHHPVGGGELYSVRSKDLTDDKGTIFRVNDNWCWVRDISGEIDAQWFGVTGDGVPREKELSNAIDYIASNGGVLLFPSGDINFGLLRKRIEYFKGIKRFTLRGMGNSTTLFFDNIDPPERKLNEDWVREPSLLVLLGNSTAEFIDSPVIENLNFDYSRQRNHGGTDLNSIEECHPIPYSKGTTAISASFCLNPVFRNIRFINIYGNGIYCKKSFNPLSENLTFFNVSANQIITRFTKRMDRDSTGGAIFYWSCYSGKITNCVAWNTRTYTVDYKSPDNGQQINGTLCGYIGFWCEFGSARLKEVQLAPPMVGWLNNNSPNLDRISRGIEISNCIVYGYVIGIKGEAAVDISIINNKVLNCYLPITCSGVRGVVERNFTDMLAADDVKCPQGGLESRRSHLGGLTFTNIDKANQSLVISNNYVRTKNYPPITTNRTNLKFLYNYINIYGKAKFFDTVSTKEVYGLEITGNTYVIDEEAEPADSVISNNSKIIFSKNTLTINCIKAPHILFKDNSSKMSLTEFSDNNIVGPIVINFYMTVNLANNAFLAPGNAGERVIEIIGNNSRVANNYIESKSSWNNHMLDMNANNVIIAENKFNILDTGLGKNKGAIFFKNNNSVMEIINNKITGNKYNLSLIEAGSLQMLTISANSSDGRGSLMNLSGKLSGPIFCIIPNSFLGGFSAEEITDEPNKVENLWSGYNAQPGNKISYLLPIAGGREGIVMTLQGWREYGNIAN